MDVIYLRVLRVFLFDFFGFLVLCFPPYRRLAKILLINGLSECFASSIVLATDFAIFFGALTIFFGMFPI